MPSGGRKRGKMAYTASWYWDKGRFREKNEDSFSLQRMMRNGTELVFAAVCDGIGGLPEGECASGLAAEQLTDWFYREAGACMEGIFWRRRLERLVRKILLEIQEKLERCEREEDVCCGTTCTMAFMRDGAFLVAHVGDSRAYRIGASCRVKTARRAGGARNGVRTGGAKAVHCGRTGEERLTRDHREGAALRRCLGAFGADEAEFVRGSLKKGESLLLCTDGFCRLAPEGLLQSCFAGSSGSGDCYRRLKGIDSFVAAQGEKDNMTAVFMRYEGRRKGDG